MKKNVYLLKKNFFCLLNELYEHYVLLSFPFIAFHPIFNVFNPFKCSSNRFNIVFWFVQIFAERAYKRKRKIFSLDFFLCVPPPSMVWVNWCCVHTQYSIESLQIIHTYTTSSCLWRCWGHKWAQLFEKRIFFRKKFFFFVHNIHEVLPIMHAIACLENNFHDSYFLPFSRHLMSNITTKIELM